MAKAIFFNIPTSGHVNPSLPLAAELVRRGETVIYYLTEGYRKKVEATGAQFRAYKNISDTYFEDAGLDGSNPPLTAKTMIATSQQILPELITILRAEKPNYVLYDSMCPWGALAARILDIPSVSSQGLLSVTPSTMLQFSTLKVMIPALFSGIPHIRAYMNIMKDIAKAHDIKPMQLMDVFNAPADMTVCYTSAMFQPGGDKLKQKIKFAGPAIEPRVGDDNFPYDQLDGRPLIYISLGTVINDNPTFFRNCIAAFRDTPYQVVMSIGQKIAPESIGAIPSNFIIRPFIPQLKILERAALFITHAGMNSVNEGLYFDVPLLLVPQHDEQEITAQRTVQLGAGLKIRNDESTPEKLRSTAEKILKDTTFKENAAKVGLSLRDAGGQRRAVDEILAMVTGKAGMR